MRVISLLSVIVLGVAGCSSSHRMWVTPWIPSDAQHAEMERALRYLTGSFSSNAQAMDDPEYLDIRLEMVAIWPHETDRDGRYLYVEQAAASALDRPYRQRVYHVYPMNNGRIRSVVYALPGDPQQYAGWWRTPERFEKAFGPDDLSLRIECHIELDWLEMDQAFYGSTRGEACESSLRGASYATSEVCITADGMRTWDRGFDSEGNQVWGATAGPYRFDRVR